MIRKHLLRTVSNLPHVKEPVMKGHPSCRDTFSGILRCPLKTGFTVLTAPSIKFSLNFFYIMKNVQSFWNGVIKFTCSNSDMTRFWLFMCNYQCGLFDMCIYYQSVACLMCHLLIQLSECGLFDMCIY